MIQGIVSELYIYPIKSCQGISLYQAEVTATGFKGDREFMLINSSGKFVSQRQYPELAKVAIKVLDQALSLSVADDNLSSLIFKPTYQGKKRDVEIWRDQTIAIDQGNEVADWFNQVLELENNRSLRLVRQSPEYQRKISKKYAITENDHVSFADGYPFLLTTTGSLAELNQRIKEIYENERQSVTMKRFRPNIVVNTDESFLEEKWQTIKIGEVIFELVKPCSRCIITTINQSTGEKNELKEPLRTLSTFRQFGEQGVMFGENMIAHNTGIIQQGEPVKVLR